MGIELPEAVPAFLRLTRAQRAAAWERNPPKPMPAFNDEPRSRLTDVDREFIARYEAIEGAIAERKKQEGLERLRAYKEEQRHTKQPGVKKRMRKKRSKPHQ